MAFPYLEAVVGFMILMYLFESYLDVRQYAAHKLPTLPKPLIGVISQEFVKCRPYSVDKSRFHFIHEFVTIMLDSEILYFGILPWFWTKAGEFLIYASVNAENEIWHTLAFLAGGMIWSQFLTFLQFRGYTLVRNSKDLFESFRFHDTQPFLIGLVIFQHTMIPLQHLVSFALNLVSRSFEFQADAFAKKLGYRHLSPSHSLFQKHHHKKIQLLPQTTSFLLLSQPSIDISHTTFHTNKPHYSLSTVCDTSKKLTTPHFNTTSSIPIFSLFFLLLFLSPLPSTAVSDSSVILRPNSTILSPNRTFELGFFSPSLNLNNWYLGIWYASLPTKTYIWVANRQIPIKSPSSASLSLSYAGLLTVFDGEGGSVVWSSDQSLPAARVSLLDTGNLILVSSSGEVVWQSFDYPVDTWLPGMNITGARSLTSWKSLWDPSPGRYSLRLRPPVYGEIELVYNGTMSYWTTGNWTGDAFMNVPEMMVPYIYKFYFKDPFKKTASFGFNEVPSEGGLRPPLTRFQLEFAGELRQYTWSPQAESWNMFWAQPEAHCRVYGLCGPNGLCYESSSFLAFKGCGCPLGFGPANEISWNADDFAGGCRRLAGGVGCDEKRDGFEEIGAVSFEGAETVSFQGIKNKDECERNCLGNCSCVGIMYNLRTHLCKNIFGSLMNIRNLTSDNAFSDAVLFLRVGKNVLSQKNPLNQKITILISVISGLFVISIAIGLVLFFLSRSVKRRRMREEEEGALFTTHLKVFSFKELHGATCGFSEKLGHGGFGTVFQGTLSDSSIVAVKRLERPGNGGEKEFRAEVCTIGNVQHVNLVRLRGFCSENSHRLLVYDYMPNGPLSAYLKKDGLNMSWDFRFRVAIGTARALAYLHEECRDCIIHCDIKPENILLDQDFIPKVSDFGLAKLIGRDFSRVLATMRGTWGYVAPEWISGVAITNKADVYSYGMTMLELVGGRRNVEAPPPSPPPNGGFDGDAGDKWFFPPWAARLIIEGKVAEVVDPRLRGAYNEGEARRLGMVAIWCIQDEEEARPSMGMVVKMLEGVVEMGVPPPPKHLQSLVAGDSFPGIKACVESCDRVSNGGGGCSSDCSNDIDNRRAYVGLESSHSSGKGSPFGQNLSA